MTTKAQRLDEGQQTAWRAFWQANRMLFGELERDLQRAAGMPAGYYEILALLAEAPKRAMRMTDLAEATRSIPSRITHAVARMEESGWLRREGCPSDRRGWFAVLTESGEAALRDAAPKRAESLRSCLFDHLSPGQVDQLRQISEALVKGLAGPCQAAAEAGGPASEAAGS